MSYKLLESSALGRCVIYVMLPAFLLVAFQYAISSFSAERTELVGGETLEELVPGEDYAVLPPEAVAGIVLELCAEHEAAGEGVCSWD